MGREFFMDGRENIDVIGSVSSFYAGGHGVLYLTCGLEKVR
jgi:hypothetical protein